MGDSVKTRRAESHIYVRLLKVMSFSITSFTSHTASSLFSRPLPEKHTNVWNRNAPAYIPTAPISSSFLFFIRKRNNRRIIPDRDVMERTIKRITKQLIVSVMRLIFIHLLYFKPIMLAVSAMSILIPMPL